jgi:hypothetical protein
MRVAKVSGLPFRLSSLEASINVVPGALAAITAYSSGMPLPGALAVGAAAAIPTLSLNLSAALRNRAAQPTPYKYVASYHEELFAGP